MISSRAEYRDSLRPFKPRVFMNGQRVESVAGEPLLQPGINAIGVTYDMAADPELAPLMKAVELETGKTVDRMTQIDRTPDDLLAKLEAVRIMCRESGCSQRYLVHDAFNGLYFCRICAGVNTLLWIASIRIVPCHCRLPLASLPIISA